MCTPCAPPKVQLAREEPRTHNSPCACAGPGASSEGAPCSSENPSQDAQDPHRYQRWGSVLGQKHRQMDLTDIYRTLHPKSKQYTFFSAPHYNFSKIDHTISHKIGLNRYMASRVPIESEKYLSYSKRLPLWELIVRDSLTHQKNGSSGYDESDKLKNP